MSSQVNNQTPSNPGIAILNLPEPQVVSGTLGEQGKPLPARHAGSLVSIIDDNLLELTDFLGSFSWSISQTSGTNMMSMGCPYADAPFIAGTGSDVYGYKQRPVNWNNIPIRSHEFWDCEQTIEFVFVGPNPMVGKILITYDPCVLLPNGAWYDDIYRVDRRKITYEWDLALSNTFKFSIQGFKLDHKRPTNRGSTMGTASDPVVMFSGNTTLHDFSLSLGAFNVTVLQRLQQFNLYPNTFTILVFSSFNKSVMYTPCDPRSALETEGHQTTFAYANFSNNLIQVS